MVNQYQKVLDNYAFPQGDIGRLMNASAEIRSATRAVIGYDSQELIDKILVKHDSSVNEFEEYLQKIRPTMITEEGHACMDKIDAAWKTYKEIDATVIKMGALGSDNLSEAAQVLAEGATDQAASVEEMQATITSKSNKSSFFKCFYRSCKSW